MGMRVKGLKKAINGFDRFEESLGDVAGKTVDGGTELLMERSQFEVPKDTGLLAATAFFVPRKTTGDRRIKGVKYGEGALNTNGESYAAAVHEILKASHANPTKAKYVEDPLVQGIPDYQRIGIEECSKARKKAFR